MTATPHARPTIASRVPGLGTLRSVLRFRPVETDMVSRRLRGRANVADLRALAKRRLPGGVFDYIDGGAEDEITMARNVDAFRRVEFRPRVLVGVADVDPSTTLLGQPLALPPVLAPTGFTRIVTPGGELDVARAAARFGIPYVLSTMGTRSIEEVAATPPGQKWFQLYVWKDRGLMKDLVARAAAAGFQALVLTVDTPVLGRRERDVRRGFTLPPKVGPGTLLDGVRHPAWAWAFVRSEPITFANVVGARGGHGETAVELSGFTARQFDPSLSWDDLAWLRDAWSGPLVVKGIQRVEDARRAVDVGVQAIAVSNHGGRQLDSAPPALELIGPVAEAVGDRAEVICDGGVRRGGDIVKALALGAKACMMGRPYLYALGAAGERGVDHLLGQFAGDTRRTMALVGCRSVADIGSDVVQVRSD